MWRTRTSRLLERVSEQGARTDSLLERISAEIELTREEVRLSRQSREDLRDFIREQILRMQRSAELQARAIEDMSDQLRANTEATWRMLDRLDNGGPTPA